MELSMATNWSCLSSVRRAEHLRWYYSSYKGRCGCRSRSSKVTQHHQSNRVVVHGNPRRGVNGECCQECFHDGARGFHGSHVHQPQTSVVYSPKAKASSVLGRGMHDAAGAPAELAGGGHALAERGCVERKGYLLSFGECSKEKQKPERNGWTL
ncbi:hypothetical protein P153DRAFT_73528 [Dothidotthia symphoricarpi CBS 119687]|uniref:Uncharacterized protein n=1 Tax=Dothidotthia symphoricarpi CBS 119687 TaxID=1392245 RepID=A0A6A6A807_9PLEO|nr:uncharacterized protein P153DRAFT_73528 [Dothidotthia symphoricarpi CBS 119687]KAF2126938.1 hypothetical protein P153DRAFT_73528 [Dothidotthia symphoricarpi CBS 119687]